MLLVVGELAGVGVAVCVGVFALALAMAVDVLALINLTVGVGGCALPGVGFGGVGGLLALGDELVWLLLFGLLVGHAYDLFVIIVC